MNDLFQQKEADKKYSNNPNEVLKEYFGYDSFRPLQAEIIQTVLSKKDAVVLMPTGGGKSMCFQIPAIVQEGICIVISPLIALMKDQVEGLKANGVKAGFLNSSQNTRQQSDAEMQAINGELDLLYVSPEKLLSSAFMEMLGRINVNLFAVDEAHCISSWGHDFRPEYTKLSFFKSQFPDVPVIALTATADKLTRRDIVNQLNLNEPEIFLSSFDRPNLSLTVLPGRNRYKIIKDFVKAHKDQSGIIYCLSRRSTEDVASKLQKEGVNADFYHAGMSSKERNHTQESFIKDKTQIICATVAFGMGIDKSNIRWVIHYNLPKNIESYYQEIGRAGRDGLPSETVLFYSFGDVKIYRDMFADSEYKDLKLKKLDRMMQYADSFNCRRKILLSYFSEHLEKDCGNCDVCLNPPEGFDGTVIAQKALSGVARMKESVAMGMLINVLRGSSQQDVLRNGFHKIKTYGAGKDLPYSDWQHYIAQLVNLGLLEIAYDQNSALKLTNYSRSVLFDAQKVTLIKLHKVKQQIEERIKKSKAKTKTQVIKDELFEKLRGLRTGLAQQEGLPPYLIFTDATLQEMCDFKPTTPDEMRGISGVGEYKLENYGDAFIDAIREFVINKKQEGKNIKGSTYLLTFDLFKKGMTAQQIAEERKLSITTIYSHFATLYKNNYEIDLEQFITSEETTTVLNARKELKGTESLKEIFDHLKEQVPYHTIRLALTIAAGKSK